MYVWLYMKYIENDHQIDLHKSFANTHPCLVCSLTHVSSPKGGHGEDARLHEIEQFGSPVDKVRRVSGTVVSIVSQNLKNYYHFVCEALVRLLLTLKHLEAVGIVGKQGRWGDVRFLVPAPSAYLDGMLELLGLSDLPRLPYEGKSRLRVERLLFLDWAADEVVVALQEAGVPLGADADPFNERLWTYNEWPDYAALPNIDRNRTLAHDPWSHFYPPREGLLLLRDAIRKALGMGDEESIGWGIEGNMKDAARTKTEKEGLSNWATLDNGTQGDKSLIRSMGAGAAGGLRNNGDDWLLVLVSRSDAKSGSFGIRYLPNEEILASMLLSMVGPAHFTVFKGKSMSMREQLKTFARAAVVVAPHGAGLANLVACRPNTTLVLLPMRPHVDNTFGHMAAALSLDTWLAPDIHSYYYGSYTLLNVSSTTHLLQAVAVALREKGKEIRDPPKVDEEVFRKWIEDNAELARPSVQAEEGAVMQLASAVAGRERKEGSANESFNEAGHMRSKNVGPRKKTKGKGPTKAKRSHDEL